MDENNGELFTERKALKNFKEAMNAGISGSGASELYFDRARRWSTYADLSQADRHVH